MEWQAVAVGAEGTGNSLVISNAGTVANSIGLHRLHQHLPPTTACWSPTVAHGPTALISMSATLAAAITWSSANGGTVANTTASSAIFQPPPTTACWSPARVHSGPTAALLVVGSSRQQQQPGHFQRRHGGRTPRPPSASRPTASNNSVLVTDGGNSGPTAVILYVGYQGSGNSLVISNGGEVFVGTNLVISA